MRVTWIAIGTFALFAGSPAGARAQDTVSPHAAEGVSPASAAAPTSTRSARTPNSIVPGFETLADGSTRLFLELGKPVPYDAKVAKGVLTYVLRGVRTDRRNNTNPLVTVHFNTPVTSARLVPHGRDLWFVVSLRADVRPTVTMGAAKEGGAVLSIEFAKGDYGPRGSGPAGESSVALPPPPAQGGEPAVAARPDP
jgi:hypothetical protein